MDVYDQEMDYDDEENVIEIGPEQLEALLWRYQAKQRGEEPGEPILDSNGNIIELTDEEAEQALAQLQQQ